MALSASWCCAIVASLWWRCCAGFVRAGDGFGEIFQRAHRPIARAAHHHFDGRHDVEIGVEPRRQPRLNAAVAEKSDASVALEIVENAHPRFVIELLLAPSVETLGNIHLARVISSLSF